MEKLQLRILKKIFPVSVLSWLIFSALIYQFFGLNKALGFIWGGATSLISYIIFSKINSFAFFGLFKKLENKFFKLKLNLVTILFLEILLLIISSAGPAFLAYSLLPDFKVLVFILAGQAVSLFLANNYFFVYNSSFFAVSSLSQFIGDSKWNKVFNESFRLLGNKLNCFSLNALYLRLLTLFSVFTVMMIFVPNIKSNFIYSLCLGLVFLIGIGSLAARFFEVFSKQGILDLENGQIASRHKKFITKAFQSSPKFVRLFNFGFIFLGLTEGYFLLLGLEGAIWVDSIVSMGIFSLLTFFLGVVALVMYIMFTRGLVKKNTHIYKEKLLKIFKKSTNKKDVGAQGIIDIFSARCMLNLFNLFIALFIVIFLLMSFGAVNTVFGVFGLAFSFWVFLLSFYVFNDYPLSKFENVQKNTNDKQVSFASLVHSFDSEALVSILKITEVLVFCILVFFVAANLR